VRDGVVQRVVDLAQLGARFLIVQVQVRVCAKITLSIGWHAQSLRWT
jgi:hypothetical protein